jgi:class 3 adenylate cyclase
MPLFKALRSVLREKGNHQQFPFSGIGTLLVSDIALSSRIHEGISSEELAKAMNQFLGPQIRLANDHGGFVLMIGDGILAAWGSSFSNPSHAEVAFQVGRSILSEVNREDRDGGVCFNVRIALATGKITGALIGGRIQVVGTPFTTAKRLLELEITRRPHLLCTSETLNLVPDMQPPEPIARVRGCEGEEVAVFEFI